MKITGHNFLEFLNSNSGSIQALMAVILVLTTIWYAYRTNQMAAIMSKQLDLTSKPYLSVDKDIKIITEPDKNNNSIRSSITHGIGFIFIIKNVSNVPAVYTLNTEYENKKSSQVGEICIFPGQTLDYYTGAMDIKPIKPDLVSGKGMIQIIYWSVDIPDKKYYFKRTFNVNNLSYTIEKDEAGKYNY